MYNTLIVNKNALQKSVIILQKNRALIRFKQVLIVTRQVYSPFADFSTVNIHTLEFGHQFFLTCSAAVLTCLLLASFRQCSSSQKSKKYCEYKNLSKPICSNTESAKVNIHLSITLKTYLQTTRYLLFFLCSNSYKMLNRFISNMMYSIFSTNPLLKSKTIYNLSVSTRTSRFILFARSSEMSNEWAIKEIKNIISYAQITNSRRQYRLTET